jgi:LmbE family N-acetylglucosaminyl deacetylase
MERLALLAVTAHPGDELAIAGVLAHHAQAGVHVALACMTGGHSPQEAHDLRCACNRLGVSELRILGFRPAEPGEPAAPGTLAATPALEVVRALVRMIRAIRPQVMLTFGPDGIDGSPEHVAVGDLATQAFGATDDLAQFPAEEGAEPYAPAKLYYFGLPEGLLRLAGIPGPGTPDPAISARADVGALVDLKLEAARCYHNGMELELAGLYSLPPAERRHLLSVEFLTLAQPQPAVDDRRDPHLFAGLP